MKKTFKILLFTTLALGCCGSIDAKKKQKFDVNPDLPMSIRMAQSEIIRNPEGWMLDFSQKLKWNYCHGLECQSFLDVYDHYKGEKKYAKAVAPFYTYVKDYADTIINENGIIYGYKKTNYNLDHVNSGKILFRLYDREKDPRYKIAMDTLRAQLASQPRTSEGGFWHKKVYPIQMWLDGLYMGEPYYAEYTATFDADNTQAYADIVNQFLLVAKRTYDKETGLYRHAWDEIKALPWSDKSGRAPHVWGRALGWYMMAIVDVLDYLPESQPGRDKMITILQNIVKNLAKYQDPKTGAWCQVIDQTGREGNYLEMSCTPMYAYAIAKGVRKGYLDPSALEMAKKAYQGILDNFIKVDEKGLVSLTNVCGVAGLGGKPYRDGSFDYYVNEIVRDNDPKGVAPFIMLCLEMNN